MTGSHLINMVVFVFERNKNLVVGDGIAIPASRNQIQGVVARIVAPRDNVIDFRGFSLAANANIGVSLQNRISQWFSCAWHFQHQKAAVLCLPNLLSREVGRYRTTAL
jgi:hypothetical protein